MITNKGKNMGTRTGIQHQKPNGQWVTCEHKWGKCRYPQRHQQGNNKSNAFDNSSKRPQRSKRKSGKKSGLLQSNEKVSNKLETLAVNKESLDSFTDLDYQEYQRDIVRLLYLNSEDTSGLYPYNVVYERKPEEYMENSVDFLVDYYNSSPETQEQFYNMLENVVEDCLNSWYSGSNMYSDDFSRDYEAPAIPDALSGFVYSSSGQENWDAAVEQIVEMYSDSDDEDKKALNDYLEIEWGCYDDGCDHEDCYIENFNTKKFVNGYSDGEFAAAFILEHKPYMINKDVIIEMENLTRTERYSQDWNKSWKISNRDQPNSTLFVPFIVKNKDLISKYNKEKGLNFNIDKNVNLLDSKHRNIQPHEDIW